MTKDKQIIDIDVIIGLLAKSNLPTVIIEGKDDVIVYRRMEDIFQDVGLSVMPVGGRGNLLKIFDRLDELPTRKNIAFIADLDTWVMSEVPEKYISNRLIFTDGFSIENDIFRDGDLEKIMIKAEKAKYDEDICKFVKWYALALNRITEEQENSILDLFPGVILDDHKKYNDQMALKAGEIYPTHIHNIVISDYRKLLRGKSLMKILSRQVSHQDRPNRIHTNSFLDIFSASPGPLLQKTHARIEKIFRSVKYSH